MVWALSYFIPFISYPYVGEAVACDLCGATDTVPICDHDRRFKRLRTVACRRCGLLRTDPMPTTGEIEAYYRNAYRRDYQLAGRRPSRRHLLRSRRRAQKRLAYLAPALRPGTRILDFGSGAGVLLGMAAAAGHPVLGIEPGEDYAAFARETLQVNVLCDVWENIDQPLGAFGLITACDVLEHLRKPVTALRWLTAHLARDGIIYVGVPNVLPNDKETFRRFHFAHLHHFTPTTLLRAAMACGLELDPRFAPVGTRMVFRKGDAPTQPPSDLDRGADMRHLYAADSIVRYLVTGAWLAPRIRHLASTLHDIAIARRFRRKR